MATKKAKSASSSGKAAAAKKAPAASSSAGPKIALEKGRGQITALCDAEKDGIEVIRSAAYVLTDRAYAWLDEGPKGAVAVTLQLKEPAPASALEALAQTFRDELATQRLRHQISKNNVSIREHVIEQAIALAQAPADAAPAPAAPPEQELNEEQRKEIERLIAEVEEEIRQMAPKRAAEDPLKIAATWEETHGPKKAEDPKPEPKA